MHEKLILDIAANAIKEAFILHPQSDRRKSDQNEEENIYLALSVMAALERAGFKIVTK
jgi:hypothetical protein